MARDLRRIEPPPYLDPPQPLEGGDGMPRERRFSVGHCWYATPTPWGAWWMFGDGPEDSRCLLRIAHAHRIDRPVIVVLPSALRAEGVPFCVHGVVVRNGIPLSFGWNVTGSIDDDPISLSVAPSINLVGIWHGTLSRGWLEDAR